ncbi:metal-dependent hydrolase [Sphingomonas sp. LY29]|uniref:metal-dependent hydrolase n=1 Tax=Sphingomonas sp. LY29 TaxID=3095341 RepID=UPI002D769EBD|nr:metal-dependent hydrolase [Sphingomonas sp. LY29]WRP26593.1 metal-dependent hydrolase [Sphingomonas sp. LY29]
MDNFTHSLAGWALGQAGLKTKTRKGLAALILGANMPDIDVFFGWVPWLPLATHRGFTHGLVGGVLLMPPLLAGLLILLDRWQVSRGAPFKSGLAMHPGWLVALCYLGALTHPLLDMLTTYSVQLMSPLSNAWYHADGLFIIDVWLWTLLAGSIAWSRWREKRDKAWRRPVQAAIAIALGYVALQLVVSDRAEAATVRWAGGREVDAFFASPQPALSWRRDLVWREGRCYRRSAYDPLGGGMSAVGACQDPGIDDPLVRLAAGGDRELQTFFRWSVLPIASVVRSRCKATIEVGDARYGDTAANNRLGRTSTVPLSGPGCPAK